MKTATDRLSDLKNTLPPDEKPGAGAPPDQPGAPGLGTPPQENDGNIPPEQVADMLIGYFNKYRAKQGLGEMNPMAATMIRAGIIGSAEKYNMTFDIVKYPELAAIGGLAWVGFDTFQEIKEKRAKEEAEKKKPPEPPA